MLKSKVFTLYQSLPLLMFLMKF